MVGGEQQPSPITGGDPQPSPVISERNTYSNYILEHKNPKYISHI